MEWEKNDRYVLGRSVDNMYTARLKLVLKLQKQLSCDLGRVGKFLPVGVKTGFPAVKTRLVNKFLPAKKCFLPKIVMKNWLCLIHTSIQILLLDSCLFFSGHKLIM